MSLVRPVRTQKWRVFHPGEEQRSHAGPVLQKPCHGISPHTMPASDVRQEVGILRASARLSLSSAR